MDKISSKKQKKIELVGQFEEKVKRAKAVVLTDYRGLTHQQLETLKKELKKVEAELVVTKNTLLKRALEKAKDTSVILGTTEGRTPESDEDSGQARLAKASAERARMALEGPTATLFAYADPITPLKELAKTIKLLKLPVIKVGLLEGKLLTGEDVLRLATLPSRDVLIAQVVGGMKSPIYGLHRAMTWNIQKLVLTLKFLEKTRQN